MRKKYRVVGLPAELTDEMDKVIESKRFGYTSRSEIAKDAIRQHLINLRKK